MDMRVLGRTGLKVSVLGFGCGGVGGLMIRGRPEDQERAVARAVELGINYFDVAPFYGNGESEKNLGRVLAALRPAVLVGTKLRIPPAERRNIAAAVTASFEQSLIRLRREQVDLLQLHNPLATDGSGDTLDAATVHEYIVPALARLRQQGKIRFCGFSAVGDTRAIHQVLGADSFDTAQIIYNLLNPSAGAAVKPGFPAQDFAKLFDRTRGAGMGVIAIRVLAAGALSGSAARHPIAQAAVAPMASGPDYQDDVRRARLLEPLVREGPASSLAEAAIRFAITNRDIATALVGVSDMAQLEDAAAAVRQGPLSAEAMNRVKALQDSFVPPPA
jgi:aryl-alcohol dehydrogenase-like predicted oxidoreductase